MPRSIVKSRQYGVRVNGILIRKSFISAVEARKWQRSQKQVQDEIRSGSYKNLSPCLLSVHSADFLRGRKDMASIFHQTTWMAKYVLMRPKFKDKYLHEIGRTHWKEIFGPEGELIVTYKLAPGTHNRVRALIHKMYEDARREYDPPRVLENPIHDIRPMTELKQTPQFLATKEDVGRYLEAAYLDPVHSWGIYSMIKLNTGLRQSNVMALRWMDIDWEGRRLWIRLKYTRRGYKPGSKGSSDEKVLGMNDVLFTALEAYKNALGAIDPGQFVCLTQNGLPYRDGVVWKAHKRTIDRAGLPYMSEHKLRHTYATFYLAGGGSIHDLKLNLFHSTVTVTEKYSHAVEGELSRRSAVFQATPSIPGKKEGIV